MPTVCPHCQRSLPDSADPPRFCSYCGQRLRDSSQTISPVLEDTGVFVPHVLANTDEHPQKIGNYQIIRHLGSGGMGRVYEAQPLTGGPAVAVKILSTRLQANPVSVERFRQEGRLAGQIAHPRCVFVMSADADQGQPYIVMELMPGDTLKDLVDRRGAIPANEAIRLTLDVIDGLQEAHRLGVIHRDIKPSNCFLMPDGRVKIGDFGLSKSLDSAAQLTQSGAFLGTILYASPEQIRGEPVDFASDVYSLGATLYHLLTGRAPFQHENPTAVLAKIISEDPPDIRGINANVPADLAQVVHRCLERDRNRRYRSLSEFKAALVALIPEQLTFGGMGVRVGAYLLDEMLVRLLLVGPLQLVASTMFHSRWLNPAITLTVFPLYFILFDGLFGRSLGKSILGLRVCRQGTTMPPGFRQAVLRTLVFSILFTLTFAQIPLVAEKIGGGRLGWSLLWNIVPFGIGMSLLIVPMRNRNDYRGLHELLSGTCVMRLPHARRSIQLNTNRVDRLAEMPRRPIEFPESIGSYRVSRALKVGSDWLAVGEDPLLGRSILMQLTSPDLPERYPPLGRPCRLWALGSGNVAVNGESFRWKAYVAPTGSPIVDAVDPKNKIRWPEARPVLEQLNLELLQAEKENTLPKPLSLSQVWVQSDGRVQLLEFPLKEALNISSVELLRQVSAVLLEGKARSTTDRAPFRAPLPNHAERLLTRLQQSANQLATLQHFADDLTSTQAKPPRISRGLRTLHLVVLSLLMIAPWVVLLSVSAVYSLMITVDQREFFDTHQHVLIYRESLAYLNSLEGASTLAENPNLISAIEARLGIENQRINIMCPHTTFLERTILWGNAAQDLEEDTPKLLNAARDLLKTSPVDAKPYERPWGKFMQEFLLWPLWAAILAFLSRGLIFRIFVGVRTVRQQGGLAYRRQHSLKALLYWLPPCVLLSAVVYIRAVIPEAELIWFVLWWLAALTIPIGLISTLIDPERSILDRMVGTWLVPD